MTPKFSTYLIFLILFFSCKQNDKIDLDELAQQKTNFSQVPDTVKKIFYSHIGPKIIISGTDTTRIYSNTNFDFVYIDSCKPKTELKSVPWIIASWFDHYELIINGQSLMTTKKLTPPFVICNQELFTSDLLNVIDTTEYKNSELTVIDLTGKLNVCR